MSNTPGCPPNYSSQVYNLHFKYDDKNTDYLDWDLGLDIPLDKPSSKSSGKSSSTTSKSETGSKSSKSSGKSSWSGASKSSSTSSATHTGGSVVDDGMPDFFFDKEHPYFSYYDDIYGDYFFADPFEQDVDCVLKDDGTPKLDGRCWHTRHRVADAQ